jgi:hypothetical protein
VISAELQALVDAGTISQGQAREAMKVAPGSDEFDGFARCMNPGCDEHEADRVLRLRRAHSQVWAPDIPVVISQTEHIEVADDAELSCPTCGLACAILTSKPPAYQRLAPA